MKANVEVRRAGNELLPLLVLGITSMALVAGMAYAVQEADTSASIVRTSQVVFAVLGGGVVAMALVVLGRGRPYDAIAHAEPGAITIEHGGRRKVIGRGARLVYVIRDREQWSVEIEERTGVTRLLVADRDEAERLAGAYAGRERVPTALYRLRKKADYYLFVTTCTLWVLVYAGLVALPPAPVFGVILVLATLPPTVWVTLKAVPTQLVVSPDGLTLIDPLRVRHVHADDLADGRVVDDDAIRITLKNGESLRLPELSAHPRDRDASTSSPPAERFEASLRELLAGRATV
jgi:hypothetical protein